MKILIVGAGPIGCYLAKLLEAKKDKFEVVVLEEHEKIGRPVHCAGLVSTDVLKEAKFAIDPGTVINHIDGAEFHYKQESFKLERKGVAVVIDREQFDYELGKESKVILNTRFVGIEKEGKGYLVETDKGEYYADVVVGADGANSSVRRIGGFPEDIKYFRGVQFRMRYDKCKKNIVQVYLRKPFFAWVIPEREGIVRVGMISDNPYQDLTNFLKEYRIEGQIIEKFAGVVPLGRCCVQKDNLVLVGDAACQVKPISHGGIYYGMRCAEILADCFLRNRLANYEKQWQKKFSHEIDIGLKIRKLYAGFSDEGLAQIFSLFKKHKGLLEEIGDFENHSKVVYALVKDSRFRKLVGDIFFRLAGDLYKIM